MNEIDVTRVSGLVLQGRRRLLEGIGLSAALAWLSTPRAVRAAGVAGYGAVESLEAAMSRAAQMREQALAAGDQGYGAVVFKAGEIVGLGPSRVNTDLDPTAHAEVTAIRDAARRLGSRDLSGCTLVSTAKPCQMCETAAYWARIDGMVFGSAANAPLAPRYSRCD